MLAQSLEKPALYFIEIAQTISSAPAMAREIQAAAAPPAGLKFRPARNVFERLRAAPAGVDA
jgi:hypothetical protein